MKVGILPMGGLSRDLLGGLSDRLAAYGIVGAVLAEVSPPMGARLEKRRQFDADAILRALAGTPRDSAVLAVTAEDLTSGAFNFVFGLADAAERVAVLSTYRLSEDGTVRLMDRLAKEAIHEIGHVLGLSHCSNGGCVMYFSTSLADTDAKTAAFCETCRPTLPIAAKPRG